DTMCRITDWLLQDTEQTTTCTICLKKRTNATCTSYLTLCPVTHPISTVGFWKASCPNATNTATTTCGQKVCGKSHKATNGYRGCPIVTDVTCSTFSTVNLH